MCNTQTEEAALSCYDEMTKLINKRSEEGNKEIKAFLENEKLTQVELKTFLMYSIFGGNSDAAIILIDAGAVLLGDNRKNVLEYALNNNMWCVVKEYLLFAKNSNEEDEVNKQLESQILSILKFDTENDTNISLCLIEMLSKKSQAEAFIKFFEKLPDAFKAKLLEKQLPFENELKGTFNLIMNDIYEKTTSYSMEFVRSNLYLKYCFEFFKNEAYDFSNLKLDEEVAEALASNKYIVAAFLLFGGINSNINKEIHPLQGEYAKLAKNIAYKDWENVYMLLASNKIDISIFDPGVFKYVLLSFFDTNYPKNEYKKAENNEFFAKILRTIAKYGYNYASFNDKFFESSYALYEKYVHYIFGYLFKNSKDEFFNFLTNILKCKKLWDLEKFLSIAVEYRKEIFGSILSPDDLKNIIKILADAYCATDECEKLVEILAKKNSETAGLLYLVPGSVNIITSIKLEDYTKYFYDRSNEIYDTFDSDIIKNLRCAILKQALINNDTEKLKKFLSEYSYEKDTLNVFFKDYYNKNKHFLSRVIVRVLALLFLHGASFDKKELSEEERTFYIRMAGENPDLSISGLSISAIVYKYIY